VETARYKEIYWLLKTTASGLKKELRKKLEDHGITWQQFHALYHIPREGIPSNVLAGELQCNASNMTGLIDRMIENGWVYREHSAEDRRVWFVKLTPAGEKKKATIFPQHHENIRKRMEVLGEEELLFLEELLKKLKQGKIEVEKTHEGN